MVVPNNSSETQLKGIEVEIRLHEDEPLSTQTRSQLMADLRHAVNDVIRSHQSVASAKEDVSGAVSEDALHRMFLDIMTLAVKGRGGMFVPLPRGRKKLIMNLALFLCGGLVGGLLAFLVSR